MFGSETVHNVDPKERSAFVPSDVMSLIQYQEFKQKFNDRLEIENAKIRAKNVALHESQPKIPELVALPMNTVTMISPKQCIIIRADYKRVLCPRGIFECPIELSDDWYLAANGVKLYNRPSENVPVKPVEVSVSETDEGVGQESEKTAEVVSSPQPLKNIIDRKRAKV